MNISEQHLDGLFDLARAQSPVASFAEVQSRFSQAIASGAGAAGSSTSWGSGAFGLSSSVLIPLAVVLTGLLIFIYIPMDNTGPQPGPTELQVPAMDTVQTEEPKTRSIEKLDTIVVPESTEGETRVEIIKEYKEIIPLAETVVVSEDLTQQIFEIPPPSDDTLLGEVVSSSSMVMEVEADSVEEAMKDSSMVAFLITETTKKHELEYIAQLARDAGIDYTYRVRHHKKRRSKIFLIRELSIKMTLCGGCDSHHVQVKVDREEKFSVRVGWVADGSGKAIKLNESVNYCIDQHDKE